MPESEETPSIEELAAKALAAEVVDAEFADELQNCPDLEEALGLFYSYVYANDLGDPEEYLREWNIIE